MRKTTKQKGKNCNRAYTSREPLLEHLLSCPLHKVYQPSPPKWLRVPLFSLSESYALCGLLRKQSGLFIKPARRGVRERARESKRPSTCNSSESGTSTNISLNQYHLALPLVPGLFLLTSPCSLLLLSLLLE